MVSGAKKTIVCMVLMLLVLPAVAFAQRVHNFTCNDCHRSISGVTGTVVNICLDCHQNPSAKNMADGSVRTPNGQMSGNDASDALGNNPGAAAQTSHFWGPGADKPAAGATNPTSTLFKQSYSNGSVACSRCHDPHADQIVNPQLLRMGPDKTNPVSGLPYVTNDMCLECHKNWNLSATHGIETHPMNVPLVGAAGNIDDALNDPNDKYWDAPNNGATNGSVALLDGMVTCVSCHGAHWVDSDASTDDSSLYYGSVVATGDGRLLRHNGAALEGGDSSICQTCHKFAGHAMAGSSPLGCQVCHGGHEYDPNGQPNIFMLKKQITLTIDPDSGADISASPLVVNLDYTTYPPTADYDNGGGKGSLCLSCHGLPVGHAPDATCATCHSHDNGFTPNCGSCHGTPPSSGQPGNTNPGGYAFSTSTSNNYFASAVYKDESATPHVAHVNGAAGAYNCVFCHGEGAGQLGSADHDAATFQDVMDTAIGVLPTQVTDDGKLSPVYGNRAGAGNCSNVYCHSNGGPRGAVPTSAPSAPVWANGANTLIGQAGECQACHGNNAATMAARGNSGTHQRHLAGTGSLFGKNYSCATCHKDTAASNSALVADANITKHVNHAKDVVPNMSAAGMSGSITYDSAAGTCDNVYCHSDGRGHYMVEDWDVQTGFCTACHNNGTNDGDYHNAIPNESNFTNGDADDAHFEHVNDPNGPQLECTVCHGANSTTGGHAGHINGNIDKPSQSVCNACHGAALFTSSGPDRQPVWTNPATVDCRTCHTGAAIATVLGVPAPSMASFDTLGHGDPALVATPDCAGCHDTSAGLHFDATLGDPQLTGGATADNVFCNSCHGALAGHYPTTVGTSTDGTSCLTCHEPHGRNMGTNSDAMIRGTIGGQTVNGFTDRNARASYWEADNSGVCQVCHDPAGGIGGINYFNRTDSGATANTDHNPGGVCNNCHRHDTDPIFKPSADNCAACHGALLGTEPHSVHINKNNASVQIEDDLTDCTHCHDGADLYTNSGSANGNHQNGSVNVAAALGYNSTDKTCASACHASSTTDGSWTDAGGLNCTACHNSNYTEGVSTPADRIAGNTGVLNDAAPPTGDHALHLTVQVGLGCNSCHTGVDAVGTHPLTHIGDVVNVALGNETDEQILVDMATATPDEAAVSDQAFNGSINTFNDSTNSCSNIDCHNPSADGHAATWGVSTVSCQLCHGDGAVAPATSGIASGSHKQHLDNAAVFGDNRTCIDCHGDTTAGGTNMTHRNGATDVLAAVTYVGNCTTSECHAEERHGAAPWIIYVPSPTWGDNTAVDKCQVCHVSPPVTGDHLKHVNNHGVSCANCHNDTAASNISIKAGSKHFNFVPQVSGFFDVVAGGTFNSAPVSINYTNPIITGNISNCTTSCHTPSTQQRDWVDATGCASCHSDLRYVGGAHDLHIDITGSIETDLSECVICHGAGVSSYTDTAGGNHQNGTVNLAAGISNTTCTSACHASSLGDGFWTDTELNCTACHNGSGTNDGVLANAAPATGSHGVHIADGLTCSDCHGLIPPAGDYGHASSLNAAGLPGANQGEGLTNKATAVADNAFVTDANFDHAGNTFDDVANSCSNTYCHDPSNNTTSAVWGVDTANCLLCHNSTAASGTVMNTGSHDEHLTAQANFGLTTLNDCAACHNNTGITSNNYAHFITSTGPTVVNQAVQFGGSVINGTTVTYSAAVTLPLDTNYGTCGTNSCHNNGQGGAPGAYTWNGVMANCNTCHNSLPATNAHVIHTGTTTYGPHPTGSTNCGECHNANGNNTSMVGRTTHINGQINYNAATAGSESVPAHGGIYGAGTGIVGNATVTVCNTCHGGQTAADLAKNSWVTLASVGCESCHGDYTLAQISGATAPSRAGTGYDASGHGKAGVSRACVDCHDANAAHISGVSGDTNRLQAVGGQDYSVNPNGFCNACHATSMPVHYDNTQTSTPVLGTSDDGILCVTCHDQHGQNNGQAQMVASTIATHSVTGFTDKSVRGSYSNPGAAFDGVCQVCHDNNEVGHFNRNTEETTHNSGGNCLDCHKHNDTVAFRASGCNGCHGGGTVGTVAANYWPDGSATPDRAGEHLAHMDQLSLRVYGMTATALLNTANADADQKALCAYCHNNPGADVTHNNGSVNTNGFLKLWDGTASTTTYTGGNNNCANSCHNGKATTSGQNWYDGGATSCVLCHTVGGAGANPATGLHNMTAAGVQKHDDSINANGCAECHTKPAMTQISSHINGTFVAESGVNTDRFLNNTNFTYTEAPVNTSTCTSSCHDDNGNWSRLWSTAANSTSTTLGAARCDVCHGQLNNWRSGMSVNHDLLKINDGTHSNCTQCHVAPDGPYVFASMHTDGLIQVNGNVTMNYNASTGTCNVAACHGAVPERGPGASTIFTEDLLNGADVSCNACHSSAGGFAANRFAHAKHVTRTANSVADYYDTAIHSTDTGYSFGCGNCHGGSLADFNTNHNNGVVNLSLNSAHGGPLKSQNGVADNTSGYSQLNTTAGDGGSTTCSAAYCHSDAAGTYQTTPDWYGGSFPAEQADGTNDYCANCHGNQPTTSSHGKHVIGIHNDDVYNGVSGLAAAAGAAGTGAGHGDINTALTINCNACHASTLNQWRNDYNTACRSCHAGEGNQVTSNDVDLKKTFHVNGSKDVVFNNINTVRSKAQVRDFSATETELDTNWQRVNGYKAAVDSHDATKAATPLVGIFNGTNCTVACHNGNTIAWGAASITCNACHTQLPK